MGLMTIKVFLLDDHEIVRRGLRDLLDAEDDLTVVGEATTAEQALDRIPATQPDVPVLDVGRGGKTESGIEVSRDLRSAHPDVPAIVLPSVADDDAPSSALTAGHS